MPAELWRRLVAETIGTGLLVLFGAGSVVAALRLGDGRLDFAGLGMVALAFGLAIAVAIYAFGATSGAHINPAVTVALAATRRFPWPEVPPYVLAQLVGGSLGALLIVAAFTSDTATELGSVGSTNLGDGVSYGSGFVAEAVATFLLVSAVMALAVDKRAPAGFAGLLIGLAVTCDIIVFGSLTGASMNPARTFGPYLINSVFGGDTEWGDFSLYVLAPLVGGILAALVYDLVVRPRGAEAPAPVGESGGEAPRPPAEVGGQRT